MCPHPGHNHSFWRGVVLACALWCCAPAGAQVVAADPVADYLERLGLDEALGAHLRSRLQTGPREERLAAAESLGRLYVKVLSANAPPDVRRRTEERAKELLRQMPEAESFELRISLWKATYLAAEEIAEKDRRRMAAPDEREEARRMLKEVAPAFREVGAALQRKVDQLERSERTGKDSELEEIRAQLTDARRVRSLARYYAAWSAYYLALLENAPSGANEALLQFGGMLNAVPGRPATVDRLPKALLRFDHVARAVMGCALSASMLGNHVEAVRWLDELESAENLPQSARDQLFSTRLSVLAAAGRWPDLDLTVARRRQPDRDKPPTPLPPRDARLLTVLALENVETFTAGTRMRMLIEESAQRGLGDLVAAGEVGHVLDLVQRYGTAPLGETGFIVAYVRGLHSFEMARRAHKAAAPPGEEPTTDTALVNDYRAAAGLLRHALTSPDAGKFPAEKAAARMQCGLSLFYAGDLEAAAGEFEAAAQEGVRPQQKQDALWFAIVVLDRAVEGGRASLVERRDRAAMLYLQSFPGTDNAVKLLLRQTRADLVSEEQAITMLLEVPAESPVYGAARRHAARLLYQAFRRASGKDKDFAALRFAKVGEELLRAEHARAMEGDSDEAKEAGQSVVLRGRQLLDALLSMSAPDVERAEGVLASLDAVAAFRGIDLTQVQAELLFRRLQIAASRGDENAISPLVDRLRGMGGPYSDTADRLLFVRAQRMWRATPGDVAVARSLVRHGTRVLDQLVRAGMAQSEDAATVREAVAAACAAIYRDSGDVSMRDLAIAMDTAQMVGGRRTMQSVKRLAELQEGAGNLPAALEAWGVLSTGLEQGGDAWFEARFNAIRVQALIDPQAAAGAFAQHRVLYPRLGPPPWDTKFAELERSLPARPATPPAAPAKGGPS